MAVFGVEGQAQERGFLDDPVVAFQV